MNHAGRLPSGLGDLGPDERERIETVGADLGRLFSRWGYRRVEPPAFEYYSTFGTGSPGFSEERAYRFLDRGGRLLALRPDMTTGIARMVAREAGGAASGQPDARLRLPLRLRYEGVVFRNELQGSGRSHSFRQAGVELIGEPGLEADAEVIGLACQAARTAGLPDVQLVLGHAGLAWGAIAWRTRDGAQPAAANDGSPPPVGSDAGELVQAFRRAVAAKDLVSLEGILGPQLAELFVAGPYGSDDAGEVLSRLANGPEQLARGAAELQALLALLPGYGVTGAWLDLALLRDLDYYSGAVFELVSPGQPEAIAGGGRYDSLLARFGSDLPATGFALNLSIASAAAPGSEERPERVAIAWAAKDDRQTALAIARALRDEGLVAETISGTGTVRGLLARASARGCTRLVHVADGGYREIRTGAGGNSGEFALPAAGTGGIH